MSIGRMRVVLAVLTLVVIAPAAVSAQTPEQKFHRAYYLEHEKGDIATAVELYAEVAKKAKGELRESARFRFECCREELAAADFARLMMPNTLVYAELNQPGDQLARLAEQLGLLRKDGATPAPGQRIAVSEAIFRELLGIRGAALGITGFDPRSQQPIGVVVAHAGNVEVLRGLIESALPVGGQATESIEGYATYNIENEVFVTLTRRLVVASPQRAAIGNVVRRLQGGSMDSLVDNPALAPALADRGDALLYFCVNFQPLMPMIMAGAGMVAGNNPEVRMAQALVDLQSLQTISGQLGVGDDGFGLDLSLRLAEGHSNLVFNFFRSPPIDRDTLRQIPEGTAFFLASALNPIDERLLAGGDTEHAARPVTFLDLGREIFANIIGVAIFGIPAPGETIDGEPVPGIAAVFSVHDPARSEALWTQFLGIAGMAATQGGTIEGEPVAVNGVEARRYRLPEGTSVYFATAGRNVIVTASPTALSRSLATLAGGRSVLDDPAYRSGIARLGADTTMAVMAHPGRCMEIAKSHMNAHEVREVEPFLPILENTVASFGIRHSSTGLELSLHVTGLPEVGPVVSDLVTMQMNRSEQSARYARAAASHDWNEAVAAVDAQLAQQPVDTELLWKRYKTLATGAADIAAARAAGKRLAEVAWDDADALNNYAWWTLTEPGFGDRFNDLALAWSKRSNELSDHRSWAYLDTLARAHFVGGQVEAAIALQKRAIELAPAARRGEVEAQLVEFEKALGAKKVSTVKF